MKLQMMTHGDPHRYEDNSRITAGIYQDPSNSPYYQINDGYGGGSYANKYYDNNIGSHLNGVQYNSPNTNSNEREMTTYENDCESSSMTNDDLLLRVAEEQLRPLIKEELRYTIQSKRAAKGLPSHVDIEYKVSTPEPETPAMYHKRQRRRDRNKVAAAKCRFKKKLVSDRLTEESEELEAQNHKLKTEVQRLQDERQKLMYILNLHRPTCIVRSPSCSSPTNNDNWSTSSSPGYSQPQNMNNKKSDHKMTSSSRASSLEDDSLMGITSTFSYPPYNNGNDAMHAPVYRSVIVRSNSIQHTP